MTSELRIWLRLQENAYRTVVKSPFIVSTATKGTRARLAHRPDETFMVWERGKPTRLTAITRCGRDFPQVRAVDAIPDGLGLCDWCVLANEIKPAVYRLLGPTGFVLYIGCSANVAARLRGHSTSSHFWPLVDRWTIDYFDDHDVALAAERDAILAEQPPFNVDMTDRAKHRSRRPAAQPCARRRHVPTGVHAWA